MNSLRYLPGDGYALVGTGHILMLPVGTEPELLDRLWSSLGPEASVESLLSALLGSVEMKINELPDLAIISRQPAAHVVVRGTATFTGHTGAGSETASGADIATWQERRFAALDSWTASLHAETPEGQQLPINEGVVRAAALNFGSPSETKNESEGTAQSVAAPATDDVAGPEADSEVTQLASAPAKPATEQASSTPDRTEAPTRAQAVVEPAAAKEAPAATAGVEDSAGKPEADEAPEDTQDPEVYEHSTGTDELSLASELLGRRGDAATEYEPVDADDSDTILKPRPAGVAAPDELPDPDRDGDTIIRSAPRDHSGSLGESISLAGAPVSAEPNEFVLARVCADGHPNPPTASSCRSCGAALRGEARQVRKPAMGRMLVSDESGQSESSHELTRSVIVGRQPSAQGFTGTPEPKLMKVHSPSGDISRSHLQVRIEGWHVELVDLGATNGTVLLREGQAPRRLGKAESVLLLSGDVADLGDGVSLRFEELP
ncbi:FHA domain-containing protein [Glutamicibacter sp. X7]